MNSTQKRRVVNDVAKKEKKDENLNENADFLNDETAAPEEGIEEEGCENEFEKKYYELEDKYYRLAAEYTNFQRRTKEEKEALYSNAVADAVSELLPIMDNLQRAVDTSTDATDAKTVADGVALISKMALEAFSKLGVEPIEAIGKEFDASIHNAVMHIDDDSFGKNEVVEEFQKGYKCKDKVIRYSMVKVAN